jgi:hypothetical protein
MHRSKWSTSALLAVGLTGLLAADASVARADDQQQSKKGAPGHVQSVIHVQADAEDLDQTAETRLDELAVWVKGDPSNVIYIEAHAETGQAGQSAQVLTVAERARSYLRASGVPDHQIRIVPVGQERPQAQATEGQRTLIIMMMPSEAEARTEGETGVEAQAGIGAELEAGEGGVRAGAGVGAGVEVEDEDTPEYAEADPVYTPPPAIAPTEEEEPAPGEAPPPMYTRFGLGLAVGGGVMGFVDSDTQGFTDAGGSWEARLTFGTRSPVALEAAYVGSAQNIEALGLDEDAFLLGTTLEGAARVNILRDFAVQPYLFGGLGWTRYSISNESFNTSSIENSENMGHVPVGAGLGFRALGGLMVDVRGTFRAAFNDDIMGEQLDEEPSDVVPDPDDTRAELDSWNLTAKLGWEF